MTSRLPVISLSLVGLFALPVNAQEQDQGTGGTPVTLTIETDQLSTGKGSTFAGVVNWTGQERAFDMFNSAGGAGGTYRRNLRLNAPDTVQFRDDMRTAHDKGYNLWMTVMGTPPHLATASVGTEFESGLPPAGRSMPSDPGAWADEIVAALTDLQAVEGILPDYIEIWNEPDRPEFFSGDIQDYLILYTYASERIRGAFPGIRIGGPGLAIAGATMGGAIPALEELTHYAILNDLPLDFLSWHHYEFTNSMTLDKTAEQMRTLATSLGRPMVEMIVSEWNIHPGVTHFPLDFDRAEAAANLAGFLTTALQEGVDRNMFFQLVDVTGETGMPDLQGGGMGSLTTYGIKKPSFHVMQTILEMLGEDQVKTFSAVPELGVRAFTTRSGNRVRMVLSNVPVNTDWLLEQRAAALGMSGPDLEAMVLPAFQAAPSVPPTVPELMAAGLSEQLATDALDIYLERKSARASRWAPRNVHIKVRNLGGSYTLGDVTRFDDDHNDLSGNAVGRLQDHLATAETEAKRLTLVDIADYLTSIGRPTSYQQLAGISDLETFATSNGMNSGLMDTLTLMYRDRLHDNRLASETLLNDLPFLQLTKETAEAAGVTSSNGMITLTLAPHSVLILDILLD